MSILGVLSVLYWSIALEAIAADAPVITGRPATPTNSRTATFTFTGSGSGVLECSLDATGFVPCTSPRMYFGLEQGEHTFAVKSVRRTNESGAVTYTWTVDLTPPPAPLFTATPADPTSAATSTFAWSDAESGVAFDCSLDSGAWRPCSSPYQVALANSDLGDHLFGVRAVDAAGNASWPTYYSFTYATPTALSVLPFTISGSVQGLSIGVSQPVRVTLTNPNPVSIRVTELRVAVSADSTPPGCHSAGNIRLTQSSISVSSPVDVPAHASVTLPAQGATAPRILLVDLPSVNQDICRNKSFTLTYSGRASN